MEFRNGNAFGYTGRYNLANNEDRLRALFFVSSSLLPPFLPLSLSHRSLSYFGLEMTQLMNNFLLIIHDTFFLVIHHHPRSSSWYVALLTLPLPLPLPDDNDEYHCDDDAIAMRGISLPVYRSVVVLFVFSSIRTRHD